MIRFFSLEDAKADAPIVSSVSGSVTSVRELQSLNAPDAMDTMVSGSTTDSSVILPEKAFCPMDTTLYPPIASGTVSTFSLPWYAVMVTWLSEMLYSQSPSSSPIV